VSDVPGFRGTAGAGGGLNGGGPNVGNGGGNGGGANGGGGGNGGAVQTAAQLMQTGKHAQAVDLLLSHLSTEPEDVTALSILPGALWGAGRHNEALTIAQSTAEAHPGDADLAIAYAEVALTMVLWDEAIDAAEDAIELRPTSFDAHRILAIALSGVERLPEADVVLKRALELGDADGEPEGDLLVMQSAVLNDWPGRREEALAYTRQAVGIDPTNESYRSRLASMQMGMRDYWGAVRTSLGVLASSPTRDIARGTLIIALASTQFRTIWLQFAIAVLTPMISLGFLGEPLGLADDPRLTGHIGGLLGTVLNALLLWRIWRKMGSDKQVYRAVGRTVRKFPGAAIALVFQALAVLFPLIAAVTGLIGFVRGALGVVLLASLFFRFTYTPMVRAGVQLFGPEIAKAAGF
jgi:Flp pilus assembly protein TadD